MAEPLAIVIHSGDPRRVHYALVLLSAAAAIGRPTIGFFAGPSILALTGSGLPGAAALDESHASRGIAGSGTLLEACRDMKVRLIACEIALRAHDLEPSSLCADLEVEVAGAVTLLHDAERGQMLFV